MVVCQLPLLSGDGDTSIQLRVAPGDGDTSIQSWLDKLQSGYSKRFAACFQECGVEHVADLPHLGDDGLTSLKDALAAAGCIGAMCNRMHVAIEQECGKKPTPGVVAHAIAVPPSVPTAAGDEAPCVARAAKMEDLTRQDTCESGYRWHNRGSGSNSGSLASEEPRADASPPPCAQPPLPLREPPRRPDSGGTLGFLFRVLSCSNGVGGPDDNPSHNAECVGMDNDNTDNGGKAPPPPPHVLWCVWDDSSDVGDDDCAEDDDDCAEDGDDDAAARENEAAFDDDKLARVLRAVYARHRHDPALTRRTLTELTEAELGGADLSNRRLTVKLTIALIKHEEAEAAEVAKAADAIALIKHEEAEAAEAAETAEAIALIKHEEAEAIASIKHAEAEAIALIKHKEAAEVTEAAEAIALIKREEAEAIALIKHAEAEAIALIKHEEAEESLRLFFVRAIALLECTF